MTTKRRSYNEFCGLAAALDVVGERWTLLIVRNLVLGPQRYSELLRGLPGITTNLLAKRLRQLEESGLVEKVALSAGERSHAYRLTPAGWDLEPVCHALGRFGWRFLDRPPGPDEHLNLEWLLVALRRRYRGGVAMTVEWIADATPYRFVLTAERADITRGTEPGADLRVRGPASSFVALILDGGARGLHVDRGADRFAEFASAFARAEGG